MTHAILAPRTNTHGDCWGYTPSCFAIPQEQSPAVLMTISIEANSRNLNTTETILLSLVGKCRDITERRDVVPESLSGQHAWGLPAIGSQLGLLFRWTNSPQPCWCEVRIATGRCGYVSKTQLLADTRLCVCLP